jgi:hypothetical protein
MWWMVVCGRRKSLSAATGSSEEFIAYPAEISRADLVTPISPPSTNSPRNAVEEMEKE